MRIFRLFLLLLWSLTFTSLLCSQIPGIPSNIPSIKDKSKNKQKNPPEFRVAEEILIDINKLPLPQDRAYVLSKVGEFFCENSERERAEELFAKSIQELMFAQTNAKESDGNVYENLIYGNFPRSPILSSISQCDKQLALDYLYKSRPPKLASILDTYYQVSQTPKENIVANATLHWEIVMEWSYKQNIISKSSGKLVQFIEEDLETSIGYKTLDYLKELSKKDPILANKLTENAVKQLLNLKLYDFENKKPVRNGFHNNMLIANGFLGSLGNENLDEKNLLTISNELLIKLTDKISQEIIDSNYLFIDEVGLRTVQRFFPGRFAQIEQMKIDKQNAPEYLESKKYDKLFENDPSYIKLLEEAKKFSDKNRKTIYRIAACKMVQAQKFEDAKSLLFDQQDEKFDLDENIKYLFISNAIQAMNENKYEIAQNFIKQIPETKGQISALGYLSERLYYDRKNPDKQKALSDLNELVNRFESSSDEEYKRKGLTSLFPSLVDTESEKAFSVFEFLINHAIKNENLDNISMFSELENKGENMVVSKSAVDFSYTSTIKRLSRSDFDRTVNNINKLKRPDSRIMIKLPILKRSYRYGDLNHYSDILDYCKP